MVKSTNEGQIGYTPKGQLRKFPRRVRTVLNFEIALWTPKNLRGNIPHTSFIHENILAYISEYKGNII